MAPLDLLKRITGRATEFSGAALEKMNKLMDEYQNALAILKGFGFAVGKVHVDVGLVPAISTSVHGSIKTVSADAVEKVIAEHPDSKLLAQLLRALLTARRLFTQFELKNDSVVLDVNLGASPKISVRFDE